MGMNGAERAPSGKAEREGWYSTRTGMQGLCSTEKGVFVFANRQWHLILSQWLMRHPILVLLFIIFKAR